MKKTSVSIAALAVALSAQTAFAQTATIPSTDTAADDDAIVVSASRSGDAIPADLIGSSVTVIGNQDLQDRQTRILSDVLRDVPGVAVNRTGAIGGLTQVRIRGAEGNHTLVFIDGIKADDPYDGEYDFGTLITDSAARVEVLRGQQGALYGSDAIGGVISYTTLSGRELPGVSARAEGGSMGTHAGSARAAGTAGDSFDYALSSSYYHTGGYPVAPGGSRDVGSNSLGVASKFNWAPAPNLKVTAVGRYSYTKADGDDQEIAPTSPVVRGYPVVTAIDTPGEYTLSKAWYGLVGAELNLLDDHWTNSASAQIADTTRDGYVASGRSYGDRGTRYRGSFVSTARFGSDGVKNRVTLAVDAEREQYHNTSPGGFSYNGRHAVGTVGFVGQYEVTVADRLALGASVRYDKNDLFDDDTTYRATASYLLPGGARFHAAYGTGVKAPTAGDLFGYSDGKYQGNPNLKPELSRGWEAGIEQEFLDKHVVIGATYFDNRFLHQIDTTYILVGGQYVATTFNNDVRTRQQGVEAYGNARFGEWRIDASYTYLHAPQTIQALADPAPPGGGFQSPVPITSQAVRRPKNSGSVNLTYAPAALPLTATLTVRYNGRQRDYAFNSDYSRLLVDMKAYTLVNLNLTYDIGRHFQIFGRVENLFGETYQEVFTFATPGRAAYGGASFRF